MGAKAFPIFGETKKNSSKLPCESPCVFFNGILNMAFSWYFFKRFFFFGKFC